MERGISVSYETIRRWGHKFGSKYARWLQSKPAGIAKLLINNVGLLLIDDHKL